MASQYAPTIDATGISAPSYAQIVALLTADYLSIFGSDSYLGNDSQDGELLLIFAQAISDSNDAVIAAYNSYSPATAQGVGLSSNVKINGLRRLIPSASSVVLHIVGIAGKTITNGVAADTNGNLWTLPASVTIGSGGYVDVVATCTVIGAVTAAAGTINKINTAVYGWQTVNNVLAAAPGAPVETDAALRVRQALSVALPSQTIFEGIVASIENLPGVTRVRGYENNTMATISLPGSGNLYAGNLLFEVEGSASSASIIQTIFQKVPPGTPLQGTVSQIVTDANGSTRLIKYDVPNEVTILCAIVVHPLSGWAATTIPLIQQSVSNYISSLPIGQNVSYTAMFVAAYVPGTPYAGTFTITSLTLAVQGGGAAATDVIMGYKDAPISAPANTTVSVA